MSTKTDIATALLALRDIAMANDIKIKRGFADFVADRIIQASCAPDLLKMAEKFIGLMNADLNALKYNSFLDFLPVAAGEKSYAVLSWLRSYPKIAGMLITMKESESFKAGLGFISDLSVDSVKDKGQAIPLPECKISVKFKTLAPFSHGGDTKAGNATLFRRCKILTDKKHTDELPFYGGGAFRGQMRDLLADHFLKAIGFIPSKANPPVSLWFFHALYSGGALEENSAQAKALGAKMGNSGIAKISGLTDFRNMVPMLSVLGSALGNRIIEGCVNFNDFVPECYEWGTGTKSYYDYLDWQFLTRREDYENYEKDEHSGMIANTECICAGVNFTSGIDYRIHISELEKSVIGKGLELMAQYGYLGAENRRGFGKAIIEYSGAESGKAYDEYLAENTPVILSYLNEITALNKEKPPTIWERIGLK
jgi:hypothetical protein